MCWGRRIASTRTHRRRSIWNATDPAFEKAMRAFGILAQGGLVVADPANPGNEVADTEEAKRRIAGALVLLNSVLDRAAPRQRLR